MNTLGLHPLASLWLVSAAEARRLDARRTGRYHQAAAAQKIYYDPLSITEDLALEDAFEAQGVSAPTVDQAFAVFRGIEGDVPGYTFEAERDVWRIRNRSTPTFEDPLAPQRWALTGQLGELTRRMELDGREVADALAWLPLLDGHSPTTRVTAALRSPAAARVFEMLAELGALVDAPEERFAIFELPELLFVGHSSVFVRGEQASILIDPAITPSIDLLSQPGRRPFELAAQVDAVLVSHNHWDHFSFQTMLRIPRETKIFVPRVARPALANPPLARYLEAFGFEQVVEVADWETISIGDVEVTFVPFFGEPFGLDSRFDAFTYQVRAGGQTIYGSLDACHDEAGNMEPVMHRLGAEQEVDVFLFGSSDQQHAPLYRAANMRHYSNELIHRPDLVRYHPNVDDVMRWCAVMRPRVIVPYANFVFAGAVQEDLRWDSSSNVDGYWSALEKSGAQAGSLAWKGDIERLARAVTSPLVMLHPLQGLVR